MSELVNLNELTFDQLVPKNSQYLSKEDVGEDGVVLTIKGFRRETIKGDEGEEEKVTCHWMEDFKPMVLNRTNSQLIAVATGARVAGDAKGKQVVVYNDPTVGFGGKITGGLRIKKISGPPKTVAPGSSADDDIPW